MTYSLNLEICSYLLHDILRLNSWLLLSKPLCMYSTPSPNDDPQDDPNYPSPSCAQSGGTERDRMGEGGKGEVNSHRILLLQRKERAEWAAATAALV